MNKDGVNIRVKLIRNDRSQNWLVEQLAKQGIKTDKTELSNVLHGRRRGKKADSIIDASKKILTSEE